MPVPRRARGNPAGCLAAPGGPPAAHAPFVRGADHAGFALRLDLGLGYTSAIPSTLDLSLKGLSSTFGILVGAAVVENLILGAEIWDDLAFRGKITSSSFYVSGDSSRHNLVGFAANLTYYFMPVNLYVSLSPAATRVAATSEAGSGEARIGLGVKLAVGKEWWAGDHWGIGVSGQLFLARNQDTGTFPPEQPRWSTSGGALAFSATYN